MIKDVNMSIYHRQYGAQYERVKRKL